MIRPFRHHGGFSLVETIVVASLYALLSLALSSAIIQLYRTNAHALAQAYEVNHARHGIEAAVRDIREMTYGDDGSYPLVEMASSSIGFFSDIDRDKSVEYVRYVVSSTTLFRYIYNATGTPVTYSLIKPDASSTISLYVQNNVQATSTFRYYKQGGVLATSSTPVTDVRYIQMNVIVNIDPNRNPGEYTLRSSASPRNLKTNF